MSENKNVGGITRVRTDNTGYNSPYLASNIPHGRQNTRVMHFDDCNSEQEIAKKLLHYVDIYIEKGYIKRKDVEAMLDSCTDAEELSEYFKNRNK